MTTQTEIKTYRCNYCGVPRLLHELEHNGTGFLFCLDGGACYKRSKLEGQAYLDALELELQGIDIKRTAVILLIGQVRHEYGIKDPVVVEHEKWLAEIAGEDQC
jgi:hypothetical protein